MGSALRKTAWALALGIAVAGCGRSTRVASGTRDQVLHIGNGAEPRGLDPATFQAAIEYTIDSALFEGLVNIANDGQTILPGVAESWKISADGKEYTFLLRPDARWSDGSPVTAGDFLYAFRRVFTPSMACELAYIGFDIAGSREFASGRNPSPDSIGLRAVDARTFEVRLGQRQPNLLFLLGGAPFLPVPPAVVERFGGGTQDGSAWARPGNMVSNGAFMLSSWHPNQDLVVTRNPHYWDRAHVRLREVHFYPIDDPNTEEHAFRAGELHVTYTLPISKVAAYRLRSDPELHVTPELETNYLFFNTTKPPFNDARVRRALSLAIDRDRLIPLVLHESASPAHSLTRPGTGGYSPPQAADYDPAQARRLLAEAGYPGGTGFPPVEFKFASPRMSPLAEALQQVWQQELGVHVAVATEEQKTFFSDGIARNYQLAMMGYFYSFNAPDAILTVPLSDSQINYMDWNEPRYDRAYDTAANAATDAERRGNLDEMERLLAAEVPLAPLYYLNQPYLVRSQVRGWRDNGLGQIDWRELSLAP